MSHTAIKTHELGKSSILGLHQTGNLRETITAAPSDSATSSGPCGMCR